MFRRVPWWGKVAGKVILSRLPIPYALWRRIGLFRHGAMLDPIYARHVFERHHQAVKHRLGDSWTVLELGPGDSVASAVFAFRAGAARTYLVDTGAYATWDPKQYASLDGEAHAAPATLDSFLVSHRAVYLTEGLASLRSIPAGVVDWVFSQAVLEHVAFDAFDATAHELYRVLKPSGLMTHQIDFRDHLAASVNSLRFSRAVWESSTFRTSGFYTNRLRPSQVRRAFDNAGFTVLRWENERWSAPPVHRRKLHRDFASLGDDDLSIFGSFVVLEKPAS